MRTICALLLVCSFAASAAPLYGAPQVEVESGGNDVARSVRITLPDPDVELTIRWKRETSSGEFGAITGKTIATTNPGIGTLRGKAGGVDFVLELLKGEGTEIEIQIGDLIYRVRPDSELGAAFSEPAPPPPPWASMRIRKGEFTAELRRRVLRATVRVHAPDGVGSGTIIKRPEGLDLVESLADDEELVVSADHVTPEHFRGAELFVDVFAYKGETAVGYKRYPARLIAARTDKTESDVSILAAKIPKDAEFDRLPIATDNDWFVYGVDYLQAGCPEGENPVLEMCRPIQAQFAHKGGDGSMNKASKKGQSGGALVTYDGILLGVLSGYSESRSMTIGTGLASPDTPDQKPKARGSVTSIVSIFGRPNGMPDKLQLAEDFAREETRWVTVRIPVRSAKYGRSKAWSEGIELAEERLREIVRNLPPEKAEQAREQLQAFLETYESALAEE